MKQMWNNVQMYETKKPQFVSKNMSWWIVFDAAKKSHMKTFFNIEIWKIQ